MIHHASIVLGRLALDAGDVPEAVARLLAAGQAPGAPTLDSFGPSMGLANELLKKGEKSAVLRYFELCRRFWPGRSWTSGRRMCVPARPLTSGHG